MSAERLPVVFFGHGSPMNALGGRYAETWASMGGAMPRPSAILMVSAHWFVEGVAVTAMESPRTIHDFNGFPDELYRIAYPAPGDPALAVRVSGLIAPEPVSFDQDWGLDHGAWSVLMHVYPDADIPVVQLSIDRTRPPDFHFDLGRRLRPLREEGVLIAGSGDVVHNLRASTIGGDVAPLVWAERFEALVRRGLEDGPRETLVDYPALGEDAMLSIPTPEHYLPLLYVLGASEADEPVRLYNDEIDLGAVSMMSAVIG
ncbi:MAG TPA: 4,5-DOPA dioxygenase extradiol [Caulobacteraceae bacterium]|nr:4,5-DOPA dioxygenase extradiol [Caulobacteraceae bacterium]